MTTVDSPNVRTVAIEGTFDDCQDLVKAMFNDAPFRERMRLSRREHHQLGPGDGAGRLLRRGLPTRWRTPLDVLRAHRQLRQRVRRLDRPAHGCADRPARGRLATPTTSSPGSCDSNDMSARRRGADAQPEHGHPGVVELRAAAVRDERSRRRHRPPSSCSGSGPPAGSRSRPTSAPSGSTGVPGARVDDTETLDVIASHVRGDGHAARSAHRGRASVPSARCAQPGRCSAPMVTLATAHPAKFPDAVERATGVRPPLPAHLADLFDRPEHVTRAAQRPRRGPALRRHHLRPLTDPTCQPSDWAVPDSARGRASRRCRVGAASLQCPGIPAATGLRLMTR